MHLRQCRSLVALVVTTLLALGAAVQVRDGSRDSSPKILLPDVELKGQRIQWGATAEYKIGSLRPKSKYEVRISYPAYYPTQFSIDIMPEDESASAQASRRILNIEKAMFDTDAQGHIIDLPSSATGSYRVLIRAAYDGFSHITGYDKRDVEFNIVLETLVFGAPFGIFKLIGLMIAFCLVAFVLLRQRSVLDYLGLSQTTKLKD